MQLPPCGSGALLPQRTHRPRTLPVPRSVWGQGAARAAVSRQKVAMFRAVPPAPFFLERAGAEPLLAPGPPSLVCSWVLKLGGKVGKKVSMDTDTWWYSPIGMNTYIVRVIDQVGSDVIEKKEGRYKKLWEARVVMFVQLIMFAKSGIPVYARLSESPDAILRWEYPDRRGHHHMLNLEVSRYRANAHDTLMVQLRKTKAPKRYRRLDDTHILAVEIENPRIVNFEEVAADLARTQEPFPLWCMWVIRNEPNTVIGFVAIQPSKMKPFRAVLDVGRASSAFKALGGPDYVRIKRAGSGKKIGTGPIWPSDLVPPPWDELR